MGKLHITYLWALDLQDEPASDVPARAVNRRPYEPYVRHRHTVPSTVPVDFWHCDHPYPYMAGSEPYFAVL
jgi:hypothetical protein